MQRAVQPPRVSHRRHPPSTHTFIGSRSFAPGREIIDGSGSDCLRLSSGPGSDRLRTAQAGETGCGLTRRSFTAISRRCASCRPISRFDRYRDGRRAGVGSRRVWHRIARRGTSLPSLAGRAGRRTRPGCPAESCRRLRRLMRRARQAASRDRPPLRGLPVEAEHVGRITGIAFGRIGATTRFASVVSKPWMSSVVSASLSFRTEVQLVQMPAKKSSGRSSWSTNSTGSFPPPWRVAYSETLVNGTR